MTFTIGQVGDKHIGTVTNRLGGIVLSEEAENLMTLGTGTDRKGSVKAGKTATGISLGTGNTRKNLVTHNI